MFPAEVVKELVVAAITYGAPVIIDLIENWGSEPVTIAGLQARLDALPKAEDAFAGEPPTE